MFLVQCEELRINHLTPLLVVTMPYACWFLWWVDYIEDFKWCLHFQFGVAFWRVVLRKVYFEGPNRVWRALKTSILNTAPTTIITSITCDMITSNKVHLQKGDNSMQANTCSISHRQIYLVVAHKVEVAKSMNDSIPTQFWCHVM